MRYTVCRQRPLTDIRYALEIIASGTGVYETSHCNEINDRLITGDDNAERSVTRVRTARKNDKYPRV